MFSHNHYLSPSFMFYTVNISPLLTPASSYFASSTDRWCSPLTPLIEPPLMEPLPFTIDWKSVEFRRRPRRELVSFSGALKWVPLRTDQLWVSMYEPLTLASASTGKSSSPCSTLLVTLWQGQYSGFKPNQDDESRRHSSLSDCTEWITDRGDLFNILASIMYVIKTIEVFTISLIRLSYNWATC